MFMNQSLSSMVRAVYARAGFDVVCPPGPVVLTKSLLGVDALRFVRTVGPSESALRLVEGRWQLLVRTGASHEDQTVAIGRGLASWWTGTVLRLRRVDFIDALGSRLILPDPALVVMIRTLGYSTEEIAEMTCLPETVLAHRARLIDGRPTRSGNYPALRVVSTG